MSSVSVRWATSTHLNVPRDGGGYGSRLSLNTLQPEAQGNVLKAFETLYSKESEVMVSTISASRDEMKHQYDEFLAQQERDREEQKRLAQDREDQMNKNRRPENQMPLSEIMKRKKQQRGSSRGGSTLSLSNSQFIEDVRRPHTIPAAPHEYRGGADVLRVDSNPSLVSYMSEPALPFSKPRPVSPALLPARVQVAPPPEIHENGYRRNYVEQSTIRPITGTKSNGMRPTYIEEPGYERMDESGPPGMDYTQSEADRKAVEAYIRKKRAAQNQREMVPSAKTLEEESQAILSNMKGAEEKLESERERQQEAIRERMRARQSRVTDVMDQANEKHRSEEMEKQRQEDKLKGRLAEKKRNLAEVDN